MDQYVTGAVIKELREKNMTQAELAERLQLVNLYPEGTAIVMGLTWIWTKIGVLLVMKSSRANEFEADEFSFNLGYGNELCALLDSICGSHAKGLFANLASSHPDKDDRIARLQELGATHRAIYGAK